MKKAQVSSEYVILVGFILAITIPMLIVYYNFTSGVNDQIVSTQLDKVAKSVVDSADTVYFLGEPSQRTIKVYIPVNVKEAILSNRTLIYRMRSTSGDSDIVGVSAANMTGNLPVSSGVYLITIKATSNSIQISYS